MHVYMHVMCRPTWCNVVSTSETESIDHWIGTVCALVRSPFDAVHMADAHRDRLPLAAQQLAVFSEVHQRVLGV